MLAFCGILFHMKTNGKRRPNHHGCLIDKGRGRNYLAKYTGPDGKVHYKSTGTSNYWEALEVLEQLTLASRPDPVKDRITLLKAQLAVLEGRVQQNELPLDNLWETYKSLRWESPMSPGTESNYRNAVLDMVKWMRLRSCRNVSDVRVELAERYLQELSSKIVLISYNNRLVLFKGIWSLLAKKKYSVMMDAWEGFQKMKGAKGESKRRALTVEEVKRLVENADEDLRLAILLSYYTAQREVDCCRLKWENVDFNLNTISLVPQKTSRKTGKRVTVHMHDELRAYLLRLKETATDEYVSRRNAEDYDAKRIQGRLATLFDKCGIQRHYRDDNGRLKILTGFHAIRHTWASNAANHGRLSATGLQSVMGWSSSQMVDTYVHAADESVTRAVESIERIGVA